MTYYRWAQYEHKEPETLSWIDRNVRGTDVMFDVGANVGVYTIYAALRHPEARVIAFEPEYANAHLLRDNLIANGLHGRVRTFSVALGSRTGPSWLHIQDTRPGAALHTESPDDLSTTRTGHRVIAQEGIWTTRLDDFCRSTELLPDALKIDVDGTEPEILAGAAQTLARVRTILIEIPQSPTDADACRAALAAAGLVRIDIDRPEGNANEVWERM